MAASCERSVSLPGPKIWDMLPNDFKTIANLNTFKNKIKNGNLKPVLADSL